MPAISFINNIAVDLGSENTRVLGDDKGEVFTCPSCVLVDANKSGVVYAAGREARRMGGRTSEDTVLVNPIRYGAVADSELAAMLLLNAIEQSSLRRKALDKSRLILTVPEGATRVERAALVNCAQMAGAKRVMVIKSPVAAAISLKKRVEKAEGQLVVSIGAQVSEISILSAGGIAMNRHIKGGGAAFDAAIVEYVRKTHGLVISQDVAGELKRALGSAVPTDKAVSQLLSGRSIRTGRPTTVEVSTQDIYNALEQPIAALVGNICDALFNVPSEFSSDILKGGLCLTGGETELHGFAQRLQDETQLDVSQSDEPRFDAVRGALRAASDDRLSRALSAGYSVYEI